MEFINQIFILLLWIISKLAMTILTWWYIFIPLVLMIIGISAKYIMKNREQSSFEKEEKLQSRYSIIIKCLFLLIIVLLIFGLFTIDI